MKYIRIPNLDKWQHYKDRSPSWIKLHRDLLHDYKFATLPDVAKAHLMQLWLIASLSANVIPYDEKWIAKQINATSKVDLKQLELLGFIEVLQNDSELLAVGYQPASPRREENIKKERREEQKVQMDRFLMFWQEYPRKVNKKKALAAWMKYDFTNGLFEKVMTNLEAVKGSDQWIKDDGQFIPHPTTWINGERWDDDIDGSGEEKLKLDWGDNENA